MIYLERRTGWCITCRRGFHTSAPEPGAYCYFCAQSRPAPAPISGGEDTDMHVEIETAEPGYLTVGGYTVHAPTFRDADQFDRAIQRGFDAGLRVEPTDRPDTFLVTNPGSTTSYSTSRTACSCKAGQTSTPCKHIAMLCFLLDVSPAEKAVPA